MLHISISTETPQGSWLFLVGLPGPQRYYMFNILSYSSASFLQDFELLGWTEVHGLRSHRHFGTPGTPSKAVGPATREEPNFSENTMDLTSASVLDATTDDAKENPPK